MRQVIADALWPRAIVVSVVVILVLKGIGWNVVCM